ncbi:hypothetical protein ACFWPQ_17815, partial [Streptomyces sp. NPDC058464]|uniref:hypothetical protein n=1 Tax=Streptomyces sp. NPDC058464 TaxID=3346511 RepID=UPI003656DD31
MVVEWEGGESEHLPVPVPESVRTLVPGTIRYKAATDLAALQSDFESDPVKLLVELIRELQKPVTIPALREHAAKLGIAAHMFVDEWGHVRQLLLAHPHVRPAGRGGVRWSSGGSGSRGSRRQLSASEALRELANKPRMKATTRQVLTDVVSAGLDELSPYELLAAHALDVPVTGWPQHWTELGPEQVPEEIRLVAVEHITEVARARSRIVLPGTEPSLAAIKSAEIPSSLDLPPLLVPLVALPASSSAADKAAKVLGGEHAWNALRTAMGHFEQALSVGSDPKEDQEERLAPLATRAKGLLKTVLMRRPKEDDLPWVDFAEEMASRACALLEDPRTREQPNVLVREWAQYVAEHPAIPAELREAARTAQATAATDAADAVEAGSTGEGERREEGRLAEATAEAPTALAGETKSREVEEVGGADSAAPGDVEVTVGDSDVTNDVSEESPEATHEPAREPRAEIAALNRLLEEERSSADAARAEHDRYTPGGGAALGGAGEGALTGGPLLGGGGE